MKRFTIKSILGNYQLHEVKLTRKFFFNKKSNFFLIDKNVYKKNKILFKIKKNIILINSNENSKSYKKISNIIKLLLKNNIKRDSTIFAIGGGIVQDIAGFVSSILFRGLHWNYIPTTILSQCDSCIGGKTSINFEKYKNQLGNFYPPKKIFLDVNLIKTLNIKDIKSGLGEMAHYYLVANENEWKFFKNNINKVIKKNFNIKIMKKLILKSLNIKKKFIEKDEFDKGPRLILNYGHTFGHAIEKMTDYKIPHGLAVAHGINISNYFSMKLKLINTNMFFDIEDQIKKIVSIKQIKNINVKNFISTLKKDKKSKKNNIRIILSKGYGKMFIKSFKQELLISNLLKGYFIHISK